MINKFIVAVVMAATVFLAGCDSRVEVSRQLKEYEVIKIYPPKRFHVDLKDVQTGQFYQRQYVSKRCSQWKRLPMYSKWQFTEITYRNEKGELSYRLDGVHGFCNSLRSLPEQ